MTHLHFLIWAATDKVGDGFSGVTYLDLIAEDMDHAIRRAKALCPGRQHYWVNNIIEHSPSAEVIPSVVDNHSHLPHGHER